MIPTSAAAQKTETKRGPVSCGRSGGRHFDLHSELVGETMKENASMFLIVSVVKQQSEMLGSPLASRPRQNLLNDGRENRGLYVSDFFINTEIS